MAQVINISETKKKKTKKIRRIEIQTKAKPKRKRFHDNEKVEPREAEPILQHDTDLCISMWRSVIVQAIYDMVGEGGGYQRIQARAQALAWFGQGFGKAETTDFELVCELAELHPQQVLECAKAAKEQGVQILEGFNFRSLRKDSSSRKGRKV